MAPGVRGLMMLAALGLSAGCGGTQQTTVEGRLCLDGKPLAGAVVQLWPQDDLTLGVYYGETLTDADGRFRLKGRDGPEVKPGKYVLLVKLLVPKDGAAAADPRSGGQNLLPELYSDQKRTPHNNIDITPGHNDLPPFDLKSKP
jgi:hypothetical protein